MDHKFLEYKFRSEAITLLLASIRMVLCLALNGTRNKISEGSPLQLEEGEHSMCLVKAADIVNLVADS